MAQRKHLDDLYVVELLDDWNVDVPSWKYPRNLESPRVSSPGFGNDSKMMVIGSLPQINLGVKGETQGGLHSGAQQVNHEFRVGSNFRIIPEQFFSGVENVVEFMENIDNNLKYYEIPTQLACAYLKGHLTGRALDWFEVLGYRVVEDKATDYAHLKQALSEQFPEVRNRSELETRFYSSSQKHNQKPSDFVYDLLKIHKILKLEMTEEKLIDHIISRLEP
ncbi:uncharacterized protein TNCV_699431 [Trichonephila clavipes]|nr:uncharacterized protein TNCV_699431 [Trichonephila clavipes]